MLCPDINVPNLSEGDKQRAIWYFKQLDSAYCSGEPFVSYLYALEHILGMIGRQDVLPYINKIMPQTSGGLQTSLAADF